MTDTKLSSGRPKKRFSQNFLTDAVVARRIVLAASLKADDCVIEIGCGHGALTEPLLEHPITLHGIEFDRSLIPELRTKFTGRPNFILHAGDVLNFRIADLCSAGAHLVGNLPYHITSPILFWMIDQRAHLMSATVMIQKEVADRIVASPGSKDYGRLSISCQFHAACTPCFVVPSAAFYPKPKVDSAIVRMEFRSYPRQPKSMKLFQLLVRRSFGQRRKMLRNTIGSWLAGETAIDLARRPETLSIEEFIELSDGIDPNRVTV